MQKCFPKHSRMGTARMKYDNETDEDGKKRGVSMEKIKAGTNERSPDSLSLPNQNSILINITWYSFTKWKKIQWNSIDKKQNGLE